MYAIQIENPEMEELAELVFGNQPVSESPDFLNFLNQQKLKKDLRESYRQMEMGQLMTMDEAFEKAFKEVGI